MPYVSAIEVQYHYTQGQLRIDVPATRPGAFSHLVLTGPNGAGKSTILKALAQEIEDRGERSRMADNLVAARRALGAVRADPTRAGFVETYERQVGDLESRLANFGCEIVWGDERTHRSGVPRLVAYLPARRDFRPARTNQPPIALNTGARPIADPAASTQFYEWLRHQHLQMRLARVDGEQERAERLHAWLEWLDGQLADALGLDGLQLVFDRETYELRMKTPGGGATWLDQLADGHGAILGIIGEILIRIESVVEHRSLETSGLVLIDELETHLHPELEERVLPFLTGLFPGIQFIVSTHSPLVVGSVPNAIVYDLRTRNGRHSSEYVGKRYGELMMRHFGIETDFDLATTRKLRRLHELAKRSSESDAERAERLELLDQLRDVDHPLVLDQLVRQMTAAEGP